MFLNIKMNPHHILLQFSGCQRLFILFRSVNKQKKYFSFSLTLPLSLFLPFFFLSLCLSFSPSLCLSFFVSFLLYISVLLILLFLILQNLYDYLICDARYPPSSKVKQTFSKLCKFLEKTPIKSNLTPQAPQSMAFKKFSPFGVYAISITHLSQIKGFVKIAPLAKNGVLQIFPLKFASI